MFGTVPTSPKRVEDYRPLVGDQEIEELYALAKPLKGARVLHLSVTAFGTGVAENLNSLVPFMSDLGLNCEWQVARTGEDFAATSKAVYNALGGLYQRWTADMDSTWRTYNALNADLLDQQFDFVVIHDPQPVGILSATETINRRHLGRHWIWHCHLDISDAQVDVWDMLRPSVEKYDAVVFDLSQYIRHDLKHPALEVIQPGIDPLNPKNMIKVVDEAVDAVLLRFGLDKERPLICQVSPFDLWHDPLGVINIYKQAKEQVPGLQLVLVASMPPDDAEARSYFELTAEKAAHDPDIHVLSSLNAVGNVEINVFQRASAVALLRAVRKGFGLSLTEAMWKSRPVIAGRTGNMPIQIIDGVTGFLVDSDEACVGQLVHLLKNPDLANEMGRRAKEHVRHNYLLTRQLRDYFRLFNKLTGGA